MIRVLLADDHEVVREGLKRMLADVPDLRVVAEAAQGAEVMAALRREAIDVVVLDLSMPGRSGVDLIRQIRAEFVRLPILVLTMHQEEQYAVRAIRAGAFGYLTKGTPASELIVAMRTVAAGRRLISPRVAELLALEAQPSGDPLPHQALSDREFEVFRLLVEGKSVGEIAQQLFVSVKTVSTHKTRILQKMSLASVPDLVRYAIKHQLSDDPA